MQELIPALIVPMMVQRMKLREFQCHKIMGNDVMFDVKPHLRTTAQAVRGEFKRVKCGVNFSQPIRYDQIGAITSGVEMFGLKRIFVDEACKDAARQFAGWIIEKGKPTNEESGYCIALCQILSELKRKKLITKIPPVRDYVDDINYKDS